MTASAATAPAERHPRICVGRAHVPADEDGAWLDWLAARLPAARELLVVGRSDALARRYAERHPGCRWRVVPPDEAGAGGVAPELIVVADDLCRLPDPLALLRRLAGLAGPASALYVAATNAARWDTLRRVVETDLSADAAAPWTPTGLGFSSPASLYKLLMDAGWMPHLADAPSAASADPALAEAAATLAEAARVPQATMQRTLDMQRLLVEARRCFEAAPAPAPARFDVVVPTTRPGQLRANVELSPGLREVDACIVSCRDAGSAAEALQASLPHCTADWVLLCHQDVYFPQGFGARLNALLADIDPAEAPRTLIGFAGIAVNATSDGFAPAGFVIDRLDRFDHPDAARAVSIDELAIVVARDSLHRIDPDMGWHLWATELCLAAICTHQVFPRIVRLPLFHNSVNDYQLPDSFYASAERLRARYPAFGPIPTLCGTLDEAFVARRLPGGAGRLEHGNFLMLDAVNKVVGERIDRGDANGALAAIVAGVHHHYLRPEYSHRALYLPQLDRRLEQLAERLAREQPAPPARPGQGTLLVATELYDIGGHSRALEDVSHEVPRPVIVLTDLFHTYDRDPGRLEALTRRFAHATVIALPPGDYWEKCALLRRAALAMNPRHVLHFAHHQDPVAWVGTLGLSGPSQLLFHHADHNASLGCTIAGAAHVDFSDSLRDRCARQLGRAATTLPLHVPDAGRRSFAAVRGTDFSVVTSGHPAKFRRGGEMALGDIVATVLDTIGGSFFHIGPLEADWVAEIRAGLGARGLDPQRFVPMGQVASVWKTLRELDAACYLGSAPVGGGRAAIEAQGCGYPLVFYRGHDEDSLLANFTLYASQELGWRNHDELRDCLRRVGADHGALSARSRELYEQRCSLPVYRRALAALLAG